MILRGFSIENGKKVIMTYLTQKIDILEARSASFK